MKRIVKDRGQSLVEFALALTFLILIVFGVLDLGRAFHILIAITNASREGARYLTTHPADKANEFTGTKEAVVQEAAGSGLAIDPDLVSVTTCSDLDAVEGCDSGYPVRVAVSHPFDLILGWFWPNAITFTRSTQMVVP